MDADDAEHGNAADIFDGGEMLFCHRERNLLQGFLCDVLFRER